MLQSIPIPLITFYNFNSDISAVRRCILVLQEEKNKIPLVGNKENFNVNNLLFNRIIESEYFRALIEMNTFQEITDELAQKATHVEPWSAGTKLLIYQHKNMIS